MPDVLSEAPYVDFLNFAAAGSGTRSRAVEIGLKKLKVQILGIYPIYVYQ